MKNIENMNIEFILDQISKSKDFIISIEQLSHIDIFQKTQHENTIENVALVAYGHKPKTKTIFSEEKFENWCRSNHILFCPSQERYGSYVLRRNSDDIINQMESIWKNKANSKLA